MYKVRKDLENMVDLNLIEAVLRRTISRQYPKGSIMDIDRFDWVPGVGLYGVERAWEDLKDENAGNFLKDWI